MARCGWSVLSVLSVLAVLAVLGVLAQAAEPGSWPRSRRLHRLGRHRTGLAGHRTGLAGHRTGLAGHRWSKRPSSVPPPSVPEEPEIVNAEDAAVQMQRLWQQLLNGTQSDQPRRRWSGPAQPGDDDLKRKTTSPIDDYQMLEAFQNDAAFGSNDQNMSRVMAMYQDLVLNHSCGVPVHQLVRVSDVHQSTSEVYVPPSVKLLRCSDSTGFCNDHHSCAPVGNVTIQLPILVVQIAGDRKQSVMNLDFMEHTECGCAPATSPRSTDECPMNLPLNDASDSGRSRRGQEKAHSKEKSNRKDKPAHECHCTDEFASRLLPNGKCKCDCFVGNRKCKRLQRGRSSLSEKDNRCVKQRFCKPPACRYGKYSVVRGRCPRQKGEFRRNRLSFVV